MTASSSPSFSRGIAATLAILREVSAPKPGNVHRGADFEDVTYLDFVQSAIIVGPILESVSEFRVGRTILDAVRATRELVATNTNLGTLLLLAPLAMVPAGNSHAADIGLVLSQLTFEDTRDVYEAIRTSAAGGLGQAEHADIHDEPPANLCLVDAMRIASQRDLVARQYCNAFADVFNVAAWIEEGVKSGRSLDGAIVHAHIRQLAKEEDSLILRKCGPQVAAQARLMAGRVLEAGLPGDEAYDRELADFDFWLRSDRHRRNPGTTADLIAAALFVLLREGRLSLRA